MRTDADTSGPTGTRPSSAVFWSGSAHRSAVAHHERHFEIRWEYEQTRCSKVSAGVSTNSRYPEALEAKARGEYVRSISEVAGESDGGEAQELAGRAP